MNKNNFSVGVLYSATDFLKQLNTTPIEYDGFLASFKKFSVASADAVLELSQDCDWVSINKEGIIQVTERGMNILTQANYTSQLRVQIVDMIERYQPTWAKRIPNGRAEARSALSKEAEQCFKEAGLLDTWDDDLIKWWDVLGQVARARKASELLQIGRLAESLSIQHEETRTGIKPKWQSLESNFSGYDVLSQLSDVDCAPLKIEVKGSTLSKKEAVFTITRNEWVTATNSDNYIIHLWLIKSNPIEFVAVNRAQLDPHIPTNQGSGTWETVRIPFKAFSP